MTLFECIKYRVSEGVSEAIDNYKREQAEAALAETTESDEGWSTTTMWVLGLAGIAVIGGVLYLTRSDSGDCIFDSDMLSGLTSDPDTIEKIYQTVRKLTAAVARGDSTQCETLEALITVLEDLNSEPYQIPTL